MTGKKYAEYVCDLRNEYEVFYTTDTVSIRRVIEQIKEVARKTGDKAWELEAIWCEKVMSYIQDEMKQGFHVPKELLIKDRFELLEQAIKYNIPHLELKYRDNIVEDAWTIRNYVLVFEQGALLVERLTELSSDDIPEKANYFMRIASAHYHFKDYQQAMVYYRKILAEKENLVNQGAHLTALNSLGLCYRYVYQDYERSDSCFRALLQTHFIDSFEIIRCEIWYGIAEGNIGRNMLLRKEYDGATPWLNRSLEKVVKNKDYAFASGVAISLTDVYLNKGDLHQAKHYLDSAIVYYRRSPRESTLARIYEIAGKYYAAVGNAQSSLAYMDSCLHANEQYEAQFSAMLLLRMEQAKTAKQQVQLERVKEFQHNMQIRLLMLSIGFLLVFTLLVVLYIVYRRRQVAYRELVRKSQEWALSTTAFPEIKPNPDSDNLISETDRQLMEQLQKLLQDEYLYRDPLITIDKVALRLKINRSYLSRAINNCMGKNFNAFINEYRIKESILLMSDASQKFSFEGLAYEVGFNDRKTFYTAFCKVTGLSPSSFKNNLQKNGIS
jgi:AraC-like DNA-binding protein